MAKIMNLFIISTMIIGCFFCSTSVCQQPYIREANNECEITHRDSSALGYFLNGLNKTCDTFLTFRSSPPYNTIAAISDLLSSDSSRLSQTNSLSPTEPIETNRLLFVPVLCSGDDSGEYYQRNVPYVIRQYDTYFAIANNSFQGLTTCQALANQTGNPTPRNLVVNQTITVPLRCACPTKNQSEIGVNYLVSYLTDEDDDDSKISVEFGVDNDLVLAANRLSELDNTVYPSTTFLVPLRNLPSEYPAVVPPPPPSRLTHPSQPPPPSKSSRNKTWLYALLGSIGGTVLLIGLCLLIFRKKRKDDPVLPRKATETKDTKRNALLEGMISEIALTLRVYTYEELRTATNGFSESASINGSVYRASTSDGIFAVKESEGDAAQEIDLLQKINHVNIIALHGVCFHEGRWFLVYEHAQNGSLSDWLSKSLSWTQRVQIAMDVATGLDYLHSFANPPCVHKDLNNHNVLLDSDFRAKIAGFGAARATGGRGGEFSLTSHIVGSVGYLAPEYLANGLVSTKIDVYAFGVVLLEMLAGREVSEMRHVADPRLFVDPASGPSEIVAAVVGVVEGCMRKSPEARPSMNEVVQVLSGALTRSLIWESTNNTVD